MVIRQEVNFKKPLKSWVFIPYKKIKDLDFSSYFFTTVNVIFFMYRFFELFEHHDGYKTGKLKLKKPEQLQVYFGEFFENVKFKHTK